MKKIILAGAAFALLASSPAFAQFPGHPDRRPPPPISNRIDPRAPHIDHRRAPPPRHMQRRPARMCVTSRGNCPTRGFMYQGQNCRCYFPGFGEKRGNAR